MILQHLKNLTTLTILIAIRQIFFLSKNWYLLITEPFSTIKEIGAKVDKSQIFLISLSAFLPAIGYLLAKISWDLLNYGRVVFVTGKMFQLMVIIQSFVIGYLSYWLIKVIFSKK